MNLSEEQIKELVFTEEQLNKLALLVANEIMLLRAPLEFKGPTKQSEQINEIMAAMAKAQGEFAHAIKDSENPYFKSKYANLAAVWQACRGPLSKNGLAVVQTLDFSGEGQVLVTTLGHSSGQWIKSFLALPISTKPQEVGSCLTYYRRYMLAAMVGVYQDDDDGEGATRPLRMAYNRDPDPSKRLTKEQADTLDKLMDQIDDDKYMSDLENYVTTTFGVTSVYDISQAQYAKILKSLEEKVSKSKGGVSGSSRVA